MANRSWFYVLTGLLISSFFGGAIHVFFSPARVREIVESVVQKKQPKFDIVFESARLELAGEWWPSIAIELSGINIKAKEPCITNSSFQADRLIVPFQLKSLFDKKIRFGHIRAGKVRIYVRNTLCEGTASAEPVETDGIAPLERFFQKRWSKEIVNTTKFLDKLSIESLELLRDDQVLSPASLENFEMSFLPDQGASEVKFGVRLGLPWVGAADFGDIATLIHIRADEVQLRGQGNLKEGQLEVIGHWAVGRGEASLQLSSKDVPMTSALLLAHHWGVLTSFNPVLKNQWASCDMSLNGEIRKFKNLELNLHQCRLYGDFGEINLKTSQLKSISEGGPLVFLLQDVDVKRALSAFEFAKNWGLVSQFGRFTGEMNINGKNTYELSGALRDLEFYIPRHNIHARQLVPAAQIDLAMIDERFSGRVYDILLDGGVLTGGLSFNFSPLGEGLFQMSLDKLVFREEVQKAIWGGEVLFAAAYGKGSIKDSELHEFSGGFALSDLKTSDWALTEVKSKFNYQNKHLELFAEAKSLHIFPESKWSEAAQDLPELTFSTNEEPALVHLTAQMNFSKGSGTWADFKAVTPNRLVKFESSGEWNLKSAVKGSLSAKNKESAKSWSIGGKFMAPNLKASDSP